MTGVETMAWRLESILPAHPTLACPLVHGAVVRVATTVLLVRTTIAHVLRSCGIDEREGGAGLDVMCGGGALGFLMVVPVLVNKATRPGVGRYAMLELRHSLRGTRPDPLYCLITMLDFVFEFKFKHACTLTT
jgi:hypothetical protein